MAGYPSRGVGVGMFDASRSLQKMADRYKTGYTITRDGIWYVVKRSEREMMRSQRAETVAEHLESFNPILPPIVLLVERIPEKRG